VAVELLSLLLDLLLFCGGLDRFSKSKCPVEQGEAKKGTPTDARKICSQAFPEPTEQVWEEQFNALGTPYTSNQFCRLFRDGVHPFVEM